MNYTILKVFFAKWHYSRNHSCQRFVRTLRIWRLFFKLRVFIINIVGDVYWLLVKKMNFKLTEQKSQWKQRRKKWKKKQSFTSTKKFSDEIVKQTVQEKFSSDFYKSNCSTSILLLHSPQLVTPVSYAVFSLTPNFPDCLSLVCALNLPKNRKESVEMTTLELVDKFVVNIQRYKIQIELLNVNFFFNLSQTL